MANLMDARSWAIVGGIGILVLALGVASLIGDGTPTKVPPGERAQEPTKEPDAPTVPVVDDKPTVVPVPSEPQELHAAPFAGQFLGSTARGRRFCIIADNSGSMRRNIPELQAQLLKTIADLDKEGEFYIYCFNSRAEPMPHPSWMKAGATETEKVKEWIGKIKATGGTQPAPAFEAALKLAPPPDVIFFMTDGLLPANAPQRIAALNTTTPKAVINTIMFDNSPKGAKVGKGKTSANRAETQLRKIAEEAGGTFTRYVPKQ